MEKPVIAELVFWFCLIAMVYTYFVYPILLFGGYVVVQVWRDLKYLWGRSDRRARKLSPEHVPSVSIIVPAYNEEARLPDKIVNLREITGGSDQYEIIFISDGSTDGTNSILSELPDTNMRALFLPTRQGKPNALNHGVAAAHNEVLVFSDAATLFDSLALQNLVRHFSDPEVGVVCGSLRFEGSTESKQTEGVYWRYEGMLRLMEARLGSTLTASGAIYALRRQCYPVLSPDTLIEDFVIPMHARKLGYRVLYDPEVVATEFAAASVKDEFTRRVRLATGSFRALGELAYINLDLVTCLAFVSHKVLRWIMPFLQVGLLVGGALMLDRPVYRHILAIQLVFYLWAAAGLLFRRRLQGVRYALVGYFLVAMHAAFLVGFLRFVLGRGGATWQRVT
ncbi:MAG TPA: glycosyltransferase family 2 protein [Terriglobia bacterium]|jgi:cellulose synthase/poly-beta-1,6-N-acetylglucosamine synthase-like glycosyltransferase|nr:glycosyltransferase family 2 protein [Terriglobia bacterium]